MTAGTTSGAVDELLGATTAYQDAVAAKRREEREAKAPAKGVLLPLSFLDVLLTYVRLYSGRTGEEAADAGGGSETEGGAAESASSLGSCLPFVPRILTTILQAYGYMEEETEAERLEREEAERQMQPDKAYKDPSQMSRKQRKKALEGVGALNVRLRCSKRRLMRVADRFACASQPEQASRARAGAATTRGFFK